MVLVARTARWCRLEDWAGEGTSSGCYRCKRSWSWWKTSSLVKGSKPPFGDSTPIIYAVESKGTLSGSEVGRFRLLKNQSHVPGVVNPQSWGHIDAGECEGYSSTGLLVQTLTLMNRHVFRFVIFKQRRVNPRERSWESSSH